ncbi:hypothetical protein [Streptomyces sp. NPDC004296]|uniref:ISAzo13-like element transposase-related protein n=1 Tax=Streptomyces sp. NPDC004296 TaxID=3364697 RepID=UPI0036A7FBA0
MTECETDTYPTGVQICDAEMAALPLTRHPFHGDWNYAVHPQPCPAIPAPRAPQKPAPEWDHALLSDPSLTGMSRQQLSDLTGTLAVDGRVTRGRRPRLTFPDQVLATVLHLRVALAAEPLAVLFGSSRTAMHRTLLKIRTLLKAHSIVISPAATPPSALTALQARVRALSGEPSSMIKTTC